jgi:hypothetical protein
MRTRSTLVRLLAATCLLGALAVPVTQASAASAAPVKSSGGHNDAFAVVVGEALPDRGGADAGVCLDHRVDAVVQAFRAAGSRWVLLRRFLPAAVNRMFPGYFAMVLGLVGTGEYCLRETGLSLTSGRLTVRSAQHPGRAVPAARSWPWPLVVPDGWIPAPR